MTGTEELELMGVFEEIWEELQNEKNDSNSNTRNHVDRVIHFNVRNESEGIGQNDSQD